MLEDIGYVLLISLAAWRLTELYKEVTRRLGLHQLAWWKGAVCIVVSGVLALTLVAHRNLSTKVLIMLAAAGLAGLSHALETALRGYRDTCIADVVEKTRSRRR